MMGDDQPNFVYFNSHYVFRLFETIVQTWNLIQTRCNTSTIMLNKISGSIPSKALRFLGHMGVSTISVRTYFNHQRTYLYPAVINVWQNFQQRYLSRMIANNQALCLGGDGRADTPGHSAKFGSYALLDLNHMVVADIQLVQVFWTEFP